MAACHFRSVSLLTRTHPLTSNVEEQLNRLRDQSQSPTTSSSSLSQKLSGLRELYDSVNDFLELPLTQQALAHQDNIKMVEDLLEGLLRLLDVCGRTQEIFSQLKACVQQLESSLRRRNRVDGLTSEVEAYMGTRKLLKKAASKCFRDLKTKEKMKKESNSVAAISMLKQVEEISVVMFQSSLSFISQSKTRTSGWSVVSKLVLSRRVACEEAEDNEMEKIDDELGALKASKKKHRN
ncbi:uncharacterized protein LOC110818264 [Carica papaya]|uniref:uncharacterized protein LOC110818264 n=1 Tax=Carica papaya TaxID=3649 RepID=UPI000B8CEEB7|nr:uncharacterized protein LOC110818264 [Carica papaya]